MEDIGNCYHSTMNIKEQSMENNESYIYNPTERQSYFHSCDDDYIVVSGSRGSGVPAPA